MNMRASTKRSAKEVAAIYREAARMIEEDNGLSCCIVGYLASGKKNFGGPPAVKVREARRYAEIFAPSMIDEGGYHALVAEMPEEDTQDFRVLALCFAAAMVEAGDA